MKQKQKPDQSQTDRQILDTLLEETFPYFTEEANTKNGLIADKAKRRNKKGQSPSSITVVGLGLSCYIVGVRRGLISREEAVKRTLTTLRFFTEGHQGPEPDAMGYQGFYYRFLDMETGKRTWECELSTIDTTFFIAGVLTAVNFYTGDNAEEAEIRLLGDSLYKRINWKWALNGSVNVCHGWKPDSGFLPNYWERAYCEALLLYMLALGSPTFPIEGEGYEKWTSTFTWLKVYDIEYIYAGPLFIHQFSHIWIDFRGIMDNYNRKVGIDYFENSRRATYIQQQYAIENKNGFKGYSENSWGFTASDGPGNQTVVIDGIARTFYDYISRGVPLGPDDGTISLSAVVASLPFAPEIVTASIRHSIEKLKLKNPDWYGLEACFNPTYKTSEKEGWISPWRFGLNEGPVVLMIDNAATGLIWDTMKKCAYITDGLRKAGFTGGWLEVK